MIAASGISNQEAQGSTRFPAAWLMLRTLTPQHEEHTRFPGIGCDSASFGAQSKKMNTSPNPPSAKAATANLAESARGAVESMRNTAQDVTKQGQEALSQVGAAATEMADLASRQVTTFASEITKMTRDNPLGALAGATMFGVLIGVLLRGRSNSE
jgi:ElaB/YqjD/DUF883 family membrane-anchored ribosome-binding protein